MFLPTACSWNLARLLQEGIPLPPHHPGIRSGKWIAPSDECRRQALIGLRRGRGASTPPGKDGARAGWPLRETCPTRGVAAA